MTTFREIPVISSSPLLITALATSLGLVLGAELLIRARGYQPTVSDSIELWQSHRKTAATAIPGQVVIIGASRAQLGLDLDTIRKDSVGVPVQLAIDGSSFLPVLRGIAAESEFRGTLLVDLPAGPVADRRDTAAQYERSYRRHSGEFLSSPYLWVESELKRFRLGFSVLYADDSSPGMNILWRGIFAIKPIDYLTTRSDRSRAADYSKVEMPRFAYARAAREMGVQMPSYLPLNEQLDFLQGKLHRLQHVSTADAHRQFEETVRLVRRIEARGGKVFLIRMPVSGLVLEAERRLYPRRLFWDKLAAQLPGQTIHFEDHPALREFTCPDGSHLDASDRTAFTRSLMDVVQSGSR